MRGVRIQAIVKELHDEKIDIIEWNPDPVIYISKAISPARVSGVYLSEADKTATVVVQEDQLSLAIGRDGQNARLAAKLTGWRIDIKSLTEATGDALAMLQSNPSLTALAEAEKSHLPSIEAILTKKDEGRPVTPEEYAQLSQFVDRVERRTVEQKKVEQAAEAERLAAARAEIPAVAFEMPLFDLALAEHTINILTEAELRTIGDVMLKLKLGKDNILGLPGIGPKSMQAIEAALAKIIFPEPEPEGAPAVVAAEAPTGLTEEAQAAEAAPTPEIQVKVEVRPVEEEARPAEEEAAPVVEGIKAESEVAVEEKPLEEIFSLKPEMLTTAPVVEEEEAAGDKKKKKKKKNIEIEYDDEKGQTIAHKKHKRGEEGWDEWEA